MVSGSRSWTGCNRGRWSSLMAPTGCVTARRCGSREQAGVRRAGPRPRPANARAAIVDGAASDAAGFFRQEIQQAVEPCVNPSRLFILRPVATSLLMAAIMLVGVIAYRLLPVSALPEVDYPTIQVTTLYPGASPEVMASSVTAPLEVQLGQMP